MAPRTSSRFDISFCSIRLARPCRALLWKSRDFSPFSIPLYSKWALDNANIAFMTGELACDNGNTSCRKGFPLSSLNTIRCDKTLQKWSTKPAVRLRVGVGRAWGDGSLERLWRPKTQFWTVEFTEIKHKSMERDLANRTPPHSQ